LRKYVGMPSCPGDLWGRALNRADAISSMVAVGDKDFKAGYKNSGISDRSAGGMGRKK
jgi:hypothetical protein